MTWYVYNPRGGYSNSKFKKGKYGVLPGGRYTLARDSYLDEGLLYQRYHQDVAPESYIYPTLYRNLMYNYYRYNPKRYAYWWWRGGDVY